MKKNNSIIHEYVDQEDLSEYQIEYNEFFHSIRNGEVINNVDYGAKSTLTAIMVRMASYSGKMITWEDAMNGTKDLIPKNLGFNEALPILPDENGFYPIAIPGVTEVL